MRIRRLRNAADRAIGLDGRVQSESIGPEASSRDELGDLSRSISGMLQRLRQHTRYLEAMPDTLAHELSNPLNVVNSSLDNLHKLLPDDPNGAKYFDRAKNGITRLGSILTNLTEAANLEDALQRGERERFNLDELVASYVEGYRMGHPDREFILDIKGEPLPIEGAPDHVAQMLDKLVDNAVDFGTPNTPIVLRLSESLGDAVLCVLNEGPSLPEGMQERLFDPMVSLGKKRAQQSRLGLGLYVVRLIARFHGASLEAANREDRQGAVFTVRFPLARPGS
jgi:signal transduction histidine kinase